MENSKKPLALELLKLLRFKLNGNNCWTKSYSDCEIRVHFPSGKIDFPEQIIVHNKSTSTLKEYEDFVVLECVDRLLDKGYPAKKIELEQSWKVGINEGGRLDVLVRCQDSDEIYLMIECKTQEKFEGEFLNTKNTGGQLFSYFQQDRSAKFLCLYTSWLGNFHVKYRCSVVPVDQSMRNTRNLKEMLKCWNKKFKNDGIFGDNDSVYNVDYSAD